MFVDNSNNLYTSLQQFCLSPFFFASVKVIVASVEVVVASVEVVVASVEVLVASVEVAAGAATGAAPLVVILSANNWLYNKIFH